MRLLPVLVLLAATATAQTKTEFINPNLSKLNGSIPSFLSKKKLVEQLGKPTKIETFFTNCAMTEEQEKAKVLETFYYGNTRFLVYDSKAELTFVDFVSRSFSYKTNGIVLSAKTTLIELEKAFPKNVAASIKENGGKMVRFKACKECDGEVRLYFKHGKLAQLEFWEEC